MSVEMPALDLDIVVPVHAGNERTALEAAIRHLHEVAVERVEDPDSRVNVLGTAVGDLRGVCRLFQHRSSPRLTLVSPRRPMLAP
jgi:hypothetical protein